MGFIDKLLARAKATRPKKYLGQGFSARRVFMLGNRKTKDTVSQSSRVLWERVRAKLNRT